jgi:hypothetical protein
MTRQTLTGNGNGESARIITCDFAKEIARPVGVLAFPTFLSRFFLFPGAREEGLGDEEEGEESKRISV